MFYFWENKREIGKAMQEKKNLEQSLFFGQSFSYTDIVTEQLLTQIWHPQAPILDAKLLCFLPCHPIPSNPNTSVISSNDLL